MKTRESEIPVLVSSLDIREFGSQLCVGLLVYALRVGAFFSYVVSFIDENSSIFFDAIRVGRTFSLTHQNYSVPAPANPERPNNISIRAIDVSKRRRCETTLTAAVILLVLVGLATMSPMATTSQSYFGVCPRMAGPVTKPEACPMVYDPVFGVPTFRTHSNSCVACSEGAWFWLKLPWM
jgi:hypothetical protein